MHSFERHSEKATMFTVVLQQAAVSMASGSYDKAIIILDQAIRELKSFFQAQALSPGFNHDAVSSHVQIVLGPSCCSCDAPRTTGCTLTAYSTLSTALLIQTTFDDDSDQHSHLDVAIITAVVLYNKGLVFQLLGQGSSQAVTKEKYTAKAKVMYEKALQLVQTCSSCADSQDFWIKSALLNNLGQISSEYCNRKEEQLYLLCLDQLLSDRRPDADYGQVFDRQNFVTEEVELSLNVILLRGFHRPSPAA
jgi:tetratricopeptide (TPR) repeat protein